MGDALLVERRQRFEHTRDQAARLVDVNWPAARQALGQRLTLDEIVDDTSAAICGDRAHALGQARMRHLSGQARDSEEAMQAARIARGLTPQQLEPVLE